MIEIRQLSKNYGSKQVLKNVNLSLERGKVYGVVGENGAGKTTLFRCIAGLEDYTGKIGSDPEPLKNHLGFLPTEPYFFSRITGREYLTLLMHARGLANDPFDEKNVFDLPLNQYASTYSTGMKKKLAFMAILLQGNDYFVLDEPFNGVDIQSNLLITEIILRLKMLGKTVVISSHVFATLSDTCDEIHLLHAGEFVKKAARADFAGLESELRSATIEGRIDRLGLR